MSNKWLLWTLLILFVGVIVLNFVVARYPTEWWFTTAMALVTIVLATPSVAGVSQ